MQDTTDDADTTVIDGSKTINSSSHPTHSTSKKGYPIVDHDAVVDCEHCSEVHAVADDDVYRSIPGGHKRWHHYVCPNTEHGKPFAAESGSHRYR